MGVDVGGTASCTAVVAAMTVGPDHVTCRHCLAVLHRVAIQELDEWGWADENGSRFGLRSRSLLPWKSWPAWCAHRARPCHHAPASEDAAVTAYRVSVASGSPLSARQLAARHGISPGLPRSPAGYRTGKSGAARPGCCMPARPAREISQSSARTRRIWPTRSPAQNGSAAVSCRRSGRRPADYGRRGCSRPMRLWGF